MDTTPLHGTIVGSYAGGKSVGIARKAEIVVAPVPLGFTTDWPVETLLQAIVNIANDIASGRKPKDTTVVNMSFGSTFNSAQESFWNIERK